MWTLQIFCCLLFSLWWRKIWLIFYHCHLKHDQNVEAVRALICTHFTVLHIKLSLCLYKQFSLEIFITSAIKCSGICYKGITLSVGLFIRFVWVRDIIPLVITYTLCTCPFNGAIKTEQRINSRNKFVAASEVFVLPRSYCVSNYLFQYHISLACT